MTLDWLIDEQGHRLGLTPEYETQPANFPYRLYRFLTDLEDILHEEPADRDRLQRICPLVRRLLSSSDWLQFESLPPDPDLGWSVLSVYDEPNFPLTIQIVTWLPGYESPIHNHGTWGIVALINGQEKNTFWRQVDPVHHPEHIETTATYTLSAGEILCLMPDAIHQVEPVGNQPVISFNVYGETDFAKRLEFDPIAKTAYRF